MRMVLLVQRGIEDLEAIRAEAEVRLRQYLRALLPGEFTAETIDVEVGLIQDPRIDAWLYELPEAIIFNPIDRSTLGQTVLYVAVGVAHRFGLKYDAIEVKGANDDAALFERAWHFPARNADEREQQIWGLGEFIGLVETALERGDFTTPVVGHVADSALKDFREKLRVVERLAASAAPGM